ncbi:hypothetical protein QYE76_059506 [Lolium multiflorum]|uniref:Uncharacterized protein n=1 Tax=Lolium multiflorum TaxID=4521 RepID=A0AAD8W2Z3_LOLMU|nr:hypothetical protein QYE76_059506 [Lolium multiflorum]
MPPRARLTRHNTPESKMTSTDLGSAEWERSKISGQDINMLKKMGFSKKENALQFPKEESYPKPPINYRPLMKEFIRLGTQFVGYRDYTKKLEGDLAESNKRADALAVKLKQSEETRQKAEKDAATIEDLRKRLHKAETSLSDNITQQSAREAEILSRLESQARRFVRRTHQEYEVDGPVGDELLDALTLVEIHGDEARDGLENAEAGLLKLFPYFFPKKETPSTFVELAKTFNGPEDLGLKLRQEGLKIGVEGTIALIADSQQDVNWAKVGNIGEMETKKWQSLIRAAKPSARPILSFLGVKPAHLLQAHPSRSKDLTEELKELRGQLQSVKKQSLILMEQSRESSEREKIALQQAQAAIAEKDSAVAEAAAATSRENSMLQLLIDASLDMAGAFLDAATEDKRVEARSSVLLRLAREHGSIFWGTPERTRQIIRFQDRALQVREYLDFCTRTLSLVYGTMFPRNKMPETLPALMDKFRDAPRIHGFVRAQLAAGARFAMIMVKICYPKLDVGQIVPKCLEKMSKRKRNFGKYDDIVTPVAEDMMDELLRMDAEFFVKGSYAEHSTRAVNNERLTIDNILGNP